MKAEKDGHNAVHECDAFIGMLWSSSFFSLHVTLLRLCVGSDHSRNEWGCGWRWREVR